MVAGQVTALKEAHVLFDKQSVIHVARTSIRRELHAASPECGSYVLARVRVQ